MLNRGLLGRYAAGPSQVASIGVTRNGAENVHS